MIFQWAIIPQIILMLLSTKGNKRSGDLRAFMENQILETIMCRGQPYEG